MLGVATPGSLLPGCDATSKRAAVEEAEGAEHEAKAARMEEEEEQQQAAELTFTETTRNGYIALVSAEEDCNRRIDEMIETATATLDALKENFVRKMEQLRADVKVFVQGRSAAWSQQSATFLQMQERVQMTGMLVSKLGIKVKDESADALSEEQQQEGGAMD
eukprot:scaffold1.g5521.t1